MHKFGKISVLLIVSAICSTLAAPWHEVIRYPDESYQTPVLVSPWPEIPKYQPITYQVPVVATTWREVPKYTTVTYQVPVLSTSYQEVPRVTLVNHQAQVPTLVSTYNPTNPIFPRTPQIQMQNYPIASHIPAPHSQPSEIYQHQQ